MPDMADFWHQCPLVPNEPSLVWKIVPKYPCLKHLTAILTVISAQFTSVFYLIPLHCRDRKKTWNFTWIVQGFQTSRFKLCGSDWSPAGRVLQTNCLVAKPQKRKMSRFRRKSENNDCLNCARLWKKADLNYAGATVHHPCFWWEVFSMCWFHGTHVYPRPREAFQSWPLHLAITLISRIQLHIPRGRRNWSRLQTLAPLRHIIFSDFRRRIIYSGEMIDEQDLTHRMSMKDICFSFLSMWIFLDNSWNSDICPQIAGCPQRLDKSNTIWANLTHSATSTIPKCFSSHFLLIWFPRHNKTLSEFKMRYSISRLNPQKQIKHRCRRKNVVLTVFPFTLPVHTTSGFLIFCGHRKAA